MAQFLTTSGISYYIESIIINAQKEFVLLSPYLSLSKNLVERLRDADKNGVIATIVYRQNKLRKEEINILCELENVNLLYSQNLHAKCYFNRRFMIITSMNIYEFSEKNNREMGILLDLQYDRDLFVGAHKEALSIINSATKQDLKQEKEPSKIKIQSSEEEPASINESDGLKQSFCIRCHTQISYNIFRPLCPKCYFSWAQYKNKDYKEKYCHQCGENSQVSVLIPRCQQCIQSSL